MQTFLFYDIETTGLNKAFDQVLQFAAIRTDLQLRELKRYEFKVKLNPDVVPSPQALLTHRISIAEASLGISEYAAIQQIHQIMNEPGTISIGYNTLGFDDEFLRFAFYRNLLPPYTHQYANECARIDLYPITIMFHLFKKNILQWPRIENETKLKLELINTTNSLVNGRAHDAMVDVEITLAIAKRFMAEQEMWDYLTSYFNKQIDEARNATLPVGLESAYGKHHEGLMVLGKIGAAYYFQAPVILLGNHAVYKNQAWLRLDTDALTSTTADNIAVTTWVYRKKLGEPGFVLPLKDRFLNYLTQDRLAMAEKNKAWLQQHPEVFKQIVEYYRDFMYTVEPSTDIDASLYINTFWTREENAFCLQFHRAPPAEKVNLIAKINNPTLKQLAVRLIGRNYPELLTDQLKQEFTDYLARVNSDASVNAVMDFKGKPRLTPQAALMEIKTLRDKPLDPTQTQLLDHLESFLLDKLPQAWIQTKPGF
ncbi:MAG: exonuclease domain-containing protein [Pseudomonadota bacterium]